MTVTYSHSAIDEPVGVAVIDEIDIAAGRLLPFAEGLGVDELILRPVVLTVWTDSVERMAEAKIVEVRRRLMQAAEPASPRDACRERAQACPTKREALFLNSLAASGDLARLQSYIRRERGFEATGDTHLTAIWREWMRSRHPAQPHHDCRRFVPAHDPL